MPRWLGCLTWSLVAVALLLGLLIAPDFFSNPDIELARKIRVIVITGAMVIVVLVLFLRRKRKRTEKPER